MRVPFVVDPPAELVGTVVVGELADPLLVGAVALVLVVVLFPPIAPGPAVC
jgi:hypothetical protein